MSLFRTSGDRLWLLVEQRANLSPDRILLVDTYGRSMTFGAFRATAERVAAGLQEQGVTEGRRVAWQLPTSLEAVVLTAALARLGAVQNPLIVMLREAELQAIDAQVRAELVITIPDWQGFGHAAAHRAIVGERAQVLDCDHRTVGSEGIALPEADPATLPGLPGHDDRRWVYVTSGSTSVPKAVWHTDASVCASARAMVEDLPLEADDVVPIPFPYPHIGGAAWLVTALRTGCRLILVDRFDPVRSPLDMAEQGATILGSATPFFRAYIAAQREHGPTPLFPALRFTMGGGAPSPAGMDQEFRDTVGGRGIYNGYGLTECPLAGFPPFDRPDLREKSSWMPGPDVEVRIVAPDGTGSPPGEQGELLLRAPQQFSGYLDEAATALALDPEGFVRTGDLASVDESGAVTITGRLKEIIVRNGENISCAEVESVLMAHPSIAEAALIAIPNPHTGERACAALVVENDMPTPTVAEIHAFCTAAGLARFKSPEELVIVDTIPRSSMGKIARMQLRAEVLAAARTPARPH
ncbi:class I adenylate-forming enzyme family protein [Nocardia jinanensis]|uniref:Long-chain-fatty-acid--CoA ligase n=1 Tax=Nocardia jinanensis TaxID=382504 RepID=A0A917RKA2_9NOCA|nr:class I adenylate-forming enzyme family protein [Nocardia jinanensis]GGL12319.1 long-chain-fatty-acid--CoA ligase [Nocardia jinanensis]